MSDAALARPAVALAACAYLVLILAIGALAWKRTRVAADYFVAGRSLGPFVAGLATMAAAFSGFVFVGGPGLTYRLGAQAFFIVLPVGFTACLLAWCTGRRVRLMAEARQLFTIPDLLALRFDRRTAGVAAIAIAAGCVAYLAAQLLALAILFVRFTGLDQQLGEAALPTALLLGTAIVLLYSIGGGMLAGIWTDVLQGFLMLVAALWVSVLALQAAGGPAGIAASLAESARFGADFLAPVDEDAPARAFALFLVFGVGVLGQPHMVHKFLMLRDLRALRSLPLVLGGSQALVLLLWVVLGLAVPALVVQGRLEPLSNPDDATAAFLAHFAPGPLAGLVFAGALAAVMSTADSFLNIGAAAIVRDLPRAAGRCVASELRAGRWATLALALLAALLAWGYGDLVALLGTFAFGTFAAALAPALAIGLNWRGVTPLAASISIALGALLNVLLELAGRAGLLPEGFAGGAPLSAIALLASFVALFALSALGKPRRPSPIVERVLEL